MPVAPVQRTPIATEPQTGSPAGAWTLESLRQPAVAALLARWVARLTWINLTAVVGLVVLLGIISERWWLSGLLTYLPRAPYALPAGLLLVVSLVLRPRPTPRLAWINGLSLALVAGPVMGLSVPTDVTTDDLVPGHTRLRIVSANVQEGRGSLLRVLHEIDRLHPDLVALQETARGCDLLEEHFRHWHMIHLREFFVASRYPLRVVDHCRTKSFDRWTALLVEVDGPDGSFLLSDTHLMTPRHGATGLSVLSPLTGAGVEDFEFHQWQRALEADETREFLNANAHRPLLIAGDFNTPTHSSMFTSRWGDLHSAFDTTEFGYGYTAPCNTDSLWPKNTPWVRIDHILADGHWNIHGSRIGSLDGSDHRLIWADVSLK